MSQSVTAALGAQSAESIQAEGGGVRNMSFTVTTETEKSPT